MACVSGFFVALCLAGGDADAQTTTATGANVAATQKQNPDRIDINGSNLGESTRPQNLTPLGISYDDCIQNLRLRYTVAVSGVTAGDNLQVWATNTGTCRDPTTRGSGQQATCWIVNNGLTALSASSAGSVATYQFDIWVRDLVGPQSASPKPTDLGATQALGEGAGASACLRQPSFAAVQIDVWFMLLPSAMGAVDGNALDVGIKTDLLGPPAPTSVSTADGDTLSIVSWQTNSDSDTTSYDVFIDPVPGQEGVSSGSLSDATIVSDASALICPDTGAAISSVDGSDAADGDGSAAAASVDAGCYTVNVAGTFVGGATTSGTCAASTVLTASSVQDSGVSQQVDEAGNVTSTSGSGGISVIPVQNLVSPGPSGVTVADKNTGKFTISGLRNGTVYNVAVAAVDGLGNVGPPSTQGCASPAPVQDFWSTYRGAGGQAGGGFCALEAPGASGSSLVAVPLGLAVAALVRRRRARGAARRSGR